MTVYRVPKAWLVFHPILVLYAFVMTFVAHVIWVDYAELTNWAEFKIHLLACVLPCWLYWIARVPYEIRIVDGRILRARSILFDWARSVKGITALKSASFFLGLVLLKHEKGETILLSDFDQWYKLVRTLISANPAIQIKGFALPNAEEES